MIGKLADILKASKGETQGLISVVEGKKVLNKLSRPLIYYLDDLDLAWSIDFRPTEDIEGIVLELVSSASNWRNYHQILGRVGWHGDLCFWFWMCSELDSKLNIAYITKL